MATHFLGFVLPFLLSSLMSSSAFAVRLCWSLLQYVLLNTSCGLLLPFSFDFSRRRLTG